MIDIQNGGGIYFCVFLSFSNLTQVKKVCELHSGGGQYEQGELPGFFVRL